MGEVGLLTSQQCYFYIEGSEMGVPCRSPQGCQTKLIQQDSSQRGRTWLPEIFQSKLRNPQDQSLLVYLSRTVTSHKLHRPRTNKRPFQQSTIISTVPAWNALTANQIELPLLFPLQETIYNLVTSNNSVFLPPFHVHDSLERQGPCGVYYKIKIKKNG